MATTPTFAATPKAWAVTVPATADTSNTAPTNTATLVTAGASGSKIEEIRIVQVASTSVSGIVNVFLYDGTTYHLLEPVSVQAATLSTTVSNPSDQIFQQSYANLVIPSGWSIRVTVSVAGFASAFKVIAFGGDF
jgi:hypothetical protein